MTEENQTNTTDETNDQSEDVIVKFHPKAMLLCGIGLVLVPVFAFAGMLTGATQPYIANFIFPIIMAAVGIYFIKGYFDQTAKK